MPIRVLGRVLCFVNVRRGSSACIPLVHMSVVAGVVLFVLVVCVGTLCCCSICIDWTGKDRQARVYECQYYVDESWG